MTVDKQLLDLVNATKPKFNPRIAEGFVMKEVAMAHHYVNNLVLSAQNDFPEGLVYIGMERVSPVEEYDMLKHKKNKTYDISKSTVFAVKLKFEYMGEPLRDQYLLLPYLEAGGTLTISGSTFTVTPVMIDKAYSVGIDSIFLYVNKNKLTFKQIPHNYFENNVRISSFIVTTDMYRGRNSSKLKTDLLRNTHKMALLPVHYLMAKEGILGMFKKYFDTDIVIGDADNVNSELYDPSEWTICSSIGVKPAQLRVGHYSKSGIRIAIRNEDLNLVTRSVIASVYYVIDHYPRRVTPASVLDPKLWYHLLALTIKPDVEQEMVCIDKLDDHFRSLDTFVDSQVKRTLAESDVFVDNIFDILVNVIKTYPDRINITTEELASMYDKRLVILRYLLQGIRNNIFNMGFDLQALNNGRKTFTKTDIEKIMFTRLKTPEILMVNTNTEVNSISNPTDNMVPTMTLPVKQQTSMAGTKKGASPKFTPASALSASIAEVGNLTSDAKDDFTGRSRLNPYVNLDDDGTIIRNPDLVEIINRTQRDIKHD